MKLVIDRLSGRPEFCAMLAARGAKRGAEIGVWTGEFSEQLCASIPGLRITCVDPWQQYPDYTEGKNDQARLDKAFQATLSRMAIYPHTILRMPSVEAAVYVEDGSLDFVYIDGNHAEAFVRQDLEAWYPKVRAGGVMSGHDYELKAKHKHVEVKQAVDKFAEAHGIDAITVLMKHKAPSWYWIKP